MSNVNDPNEVRDPWHNEQVPFETVAESAANAQASAEAGAVDRDFLPGAASAGATGAASGSVPFQAAASSAAAAGTPPPAGWGPVGAGYAPPPPPPGVVVGTGSEPSPALAFFLGLIPGVGAMYNGQVAKGFVHLIVFAVLVTLASDVNGIFGVFVAGWIFFMAFEAFHTAKARRDGLPLPNAFGWNDIGERIGLGKNWPFGGGVPVATAGAGPAVPMPGGSVPMSGVNPNADQAGWTSVPVGAAPYATQGVGPNWAGYVPPSAFAGAPPVGAAGPASQGVPYAPVNAGGPYTPYAGMNMPPAATSRLPVGAIWLIGLGVLFLLGQWTPLLDFGRVWIPSLILIAVAGLLFSKKMGWLGTKSWQQQQAATWPLGLRIATSIKTPGVLVVIAILNALHQSGIVRWHASWPWLLIEIGVLMLVERMALRQAANLTAPADAATNGGL